MPKEDDSFVVLSRSAVYSLYAVQFTLALLKSQLGTLNEPEDNVIRFKGIRKIKLKFETSIQFELQVLKTFSNFGMGCLSNF